MSVIPAYRQAGVSETSINTEDMARF